MRKQQYMNFLSKRMNPLDARRKFGEEFVKRAKDHFGGLDKWSDPAFYRVADVEDVVMNGFVLGWGDCNLDIMVYLGGQNDPYRKGVYFGHGSEVFVGLGDGLSLEEFKSIIDRCGETRLRDYISGVNNWWEWCAEGSM